MNAEARADFDSIPVIDVESLYSGDEGGAP